MSVRASLALLALTSASAVLLEAGGARAAPSAQVLSHGASAEDDRDAALVEQAVAAALSESGLLRVPGPDQVEQAALQEARDLAAEGRRAFLELEPERAIAALEQAAAAMRARVDLLEDPKEVAAVFVSLGSAHGQMGQVEQAREAFRMALTLAPTFVVEAGALPQDDLKLFLSVQEEVVFSEQGALRVETAGPSALVWVDGVPRGATPLEVRGLVPGEHAWAVARGGVPRTSGTVVVAPGRPALVVARPASPLSAQKAREALGALKPVEMDTAASIEALRAAFPSVDEVWAVRVLARREEHVARIQRIDLAKGATIARRDVVWREQPDLAAVRLVVYDMLGASAPAADRAPAAPIALFPGTGPAAEAGAASGAAGSDVGRAPAATSTEDGGGLPWIAVGGGAAALLAVGGIAALAIALAPPPAPGMSAPVRHVVLGF